jgi:hypothetical protein
MLHAWAKREIKKYTQSGNWVEYAMSYCRSTVSSRPGLMFKAYRSQNQCLDLAHHLAAVPLLLAQPIRGISAGGPVDTNVAIFSIAVALLLNQE